MRSERMCGLARYLCSLPFNASQTASTQWLERTLDDSVNRRLTLPQAFLTTDAVLRLALNVVSKLEVFPAIVRRNVQEVLPYMASENILMAAVAAGADRQVAHEHIRKHSRTIRAEVRSGAIHSNFLDLLRNDKLFEKVRFEEVLDASRFVGRAPQQIDEFLAAEVAPMRQRYPHLLNLSAEIHH
jgi:adenylosuccinate lyase